MIRLFIENKEIELDESVQFAITKQFEDLSNPVKIKNDWSKTVSIPFTARNNEIFGHIYNPDRIIVSNNTSSGTLTGIYFDPYKKLDMRLLWGDDVLMIGYAKMNEIKQVNSKGTYDITLFGQLGKLFQEMEKITFDMSTDDTQYLIDGSQYVSEYINKDLLFQMWIRDGQHYEDLYKKGQEHYNVADIIGFAPNNSFSDGFDYKNVQTGANLSQPFTEILGNTFKEATGVDPENAIPNGMLPREFGEYRSYLLLPYIYWNKLFKIFIEKVESITGYKCKLSSEWFNTSNPYWYNLVYMLKPLDIKNEENYVNRYKLSTFGMGWGGDINEYVLPKTSNIVFRDRNESVNIIDSADRILLSDDYSVIFDTLFTINLNISNYQYLRFNPSNGLQFSILVEDENSNVLDEIKYLMTDNEYSGSVSGYKEVLRLGRVTQESFEAYPKLGLTLNKGQYNTNRVKLVLKAVWLNTNAPFLDKDDNPFTPTPTTYTGYINLTLYNIPPNNPILCMVVKNRFRSYNHFNLNTLWNKDFNLFDEILKYCQMYRINVRVDDFKKKIYFEPFANYFETYQIEDWTNKVDKSKDFILKPVSFENKYVLFNYGENESKIYKDYKIKYGLNYGEYQLKTDFNFNNETVKLFGKITPSIVNTDTILSWNNLKSNNKIIYSFPNEIYVYNKDKDNKQVDIFGSFYFYTGLKQFNNEAALYLRDVYISDDTDFQSSSNNYFYISNNVEANKRTRVYYYPKLDIIKDNLLCLFNNPMENYTYLNNYREAKNIFYNLWEDYLNERYNIQNKLLTCYIILKPSDMTNFTWNTFVKIKNQIYLVNKIYDYNVTSGLSTKVDLVSILNINNYNTNNYIKDIHLELSWSTTLYFGAYPQSQKTEIGTFKSLTSVTFSNNQKSITSNGVQFTIEGNNVYAQIITKYVDAPDTDFTITIKNRFESVSFNCQRYSLYPYPWIIVEDLNGNEVTQIPAGSGTYKLKWRGTETEGLNNKPTVLLLTTPAIPGYGARLLNDWEENTVMIGIGDDEWFRTEYSVSFEVTLADSNSFTIRVTDTEGWHEERQYK